MKLKMIIPVLALVGLSCKSNKAVTENVLQTENVEMHTEKEARGDRVRGGRGGLDPDMIIAQLDLDESQEVAFLEIWDANKKKIELLRASSEGDRGAMRMQMRELRRENEETIKSILTADQIIKYDEMVAGMREKARARRGKND